MDNDQIYTMELNEKFQEILNAEEVNTIASFQNEFYKNALENI